MQVRKPIFNLDETILLNVGDTQVHVIGRAEYLNDQPRYLVEFCEQKEGFPEVKWVIQSQLHRKPTTTINLNYC